MDNTAHVFFASLHHLVTEFGGPVRLPVIPERGRIVLAAPADEAQAREIARREGTDYVLDAWLAPGSVFQLNLDRAEWRVGTTREGGAV